MALDNTDSILEMFDEEIAKEVAIAPLKVKSPDFETLIEMIGGDLDDEVSFDMAIALIANASSMKVSKMRSKLSAVAGVAIGDIRSAERKYKKNEVEIKLTHSDMSEQYIGEFGAVLPVGCFGKLWAYNQTQGTYMPLELRKAGVEIGRKFKTEALCKKESDYKGIASHTYNSVSDEQFFNEAPLGIGTPGGFYHVEDNSLSLKEPSSSDRLRFRLSVEPDFTSEPELLLSVLKDSFEGFYPEEQVRQLRMFTGMALFGLQAQEQLCLLLMGSAGSFKSGFLKVLRSLCPPEYIAVVAPTDFDSDYHKASLAGKLFNFVPEINEEKPIPSAEFKSIVGGDLISAREPYGLTFTFSCRAANWFNGNFYPTTQDQSEGFWRRWGVLKFVNSKPRDQRDPELVTRIIETELTMVLGWALSGVKDYLANGTYLSPAHYKSIEEWRHQSNNVEAWLNEETRIELRAKGSSEVPILVRDAYDLYAKWSEINARRPCKRSVFRNRMEVLGNLITCYQGYDRFVRLKMRFE